MKKQIKQTLIIGLASMISMTSVTAFANKPRGAMEVSESLKRARETRETDGALKAMTDNNITIRENAIVKEVSLLSLKRSLDTGKLAFFAGRQIKTTSAGKESTVSGAELVLELLKQKQDIAAEKRKGNLSKEAAEALEAKDDMLDKSLEYLERVAKLSDSNSSLSADAQQYVAHALKQAVLTTRLATMSEADAAMHLKAMAEVIEISDKRIQAAASVTPRRTQAAIEAAGNLDLAFRDMMMARNNGDAAKAREASKKVSDCK
jgi:hypothetical protein